MPEPTERDSYEARQEELDPHRREERRLAMLETSRRLHERGVSLTGDESSEELAALLEALERFEHAVESRGGDLMVDEGPRGITREPDDVHFVVPRREPHESVASYLGRLEDATRGLRHHRSHGA
jgi:hypothetical protein